MIHRASPTWASLLGLALLLAGPALHAAQIEAHFSPSGGVAAATTAELDGAKISIDMIAYSISEPSITRALIAARARGVHVRVIVDRGQEAQEYSTARNLADHAIQVYTDQREALQHNKTAVIDAATIITGSANFTHAANAENAENMLVIRDPTIAATYAADFTRHWSHSRPFSWHPKTRPAATNPLRSFSPPKNARNTKERSKWQESQVP